MNKNVDLIKEFASILRAKGYENVKDFTNVEGDRVATFEHNGDRYLLAIDILEGGEEQ